MGALYGFAFGVGMNRGATCTSRQLLLLHCPVRHRRGLRVVPAVTPPHRSRAPDKLLNRLAESLSLATGPCCETVAPPGIFRRRVENHAARVAFRVVYMTITINVLPTVQRRLKLR